MLREVDLAICIIIVIDTLHDIQFYLFSEINGVHTRTNAAHYVCTIKIMEVESWLCYISLT